MMRLGIDLGGTNTVVGLCTLDGVLMDKISAPTKTGDPDGLCAVMHDLCRDLCDKHNIPYSEIEQIGIGSTAAQAAAPATC